MNVKNEDCSGFIYGDGSLYADSVALILNETKNRQVIGRRPLQEQGHLENGAAGLQHGL